MYPEKMKKINEFLKWIWKTNPVQYAEFDMKHNWIVIEFKVANLNG